MNSVKISISSPVKNFWDAVIIYYQHPNSINKEILFSESVFGANLGLSFSKEDCHKLYDALCHCFTKKCHLLNGLNILKSSDYQLLAPDENINKVFGSSNDMILLVRKLIPKSYSYSDSEFYEFLFIDKMKTKLYIFTKHTKKMFIENTTSGKITQQDPFIVLKFNEIELNLNSNFLELFYGNNLGEKGINWLKTIFIKKFKKLMLNNNNNNNNKKNSAFEKLCFTSKVDLIEYYNLYEKLKSKYAKSLIENWTENTDPKKFVYEDIGIASYLIMLWNGGSIPKEGAKKQKFFDLGCGNGLLVHILNSEGHFGIGLDLRKRKIWETYHSTTVLKEETIIPKISTTYPEADWLIGNHSDELTAWIPIMARRSNDHCQFFVLPCCPYQLNGKKFQRKNSGLSSYQDFIGYVKGISELCGFETCVDKLRIPSTKRICLIGLSNHGISKEKMNLINERLLNLVREECQVSEKCTSRKINEKIESETEDVSLGFKIREPVEKVRNCTKLPQSLVNEILKTVMERLLKENNTWTIMKEGKTYNWNGGGKLPIGELAQTIDDELLKQLKKECKGLQTLLKNNHFIFEVSQGFVQFRSPESMLKISNKLLDSKDTSKWKKKTCWFFNNHPDKCPLHDNQCSYSHKI